MVSTRQDKKVARKILLDLVSKEISKDSIKGLVEESENLKKYFDHVEISEDSFFRIELKEFRNKIKNFEDNLDSQNSSEQVVDYQGLSGRTPLRIKFVYDHLFLSRFYKKEKTEKKGIKMSWRFNNLGKIDLIDEKLITREIKTNPHHVLYPNKNSFKDKLEDWKEKEFYFNWNKSLDLYFPIPQDLPIITKLEKLLLYGYNMASNLLEDSKKGRIKGAYQLSGNQKHLTEIVSNPEAISILENISCLKPNISDMKKNIIKLKYD